MSDLITPEATQAEQILRNFVLLIAIVCLAPFISATVALFLGIVIAVSFGNPIAVQSKRLTNPFLSAAIVGLGAGMNLAVVAQAGLHGLLYTVVGISFTLILGQVLGGWLKLDEGTSILITVGTAICGGSAIAAVSPVIRAKEHQISVALGIVFTLNAVALILFPLIGHRFLMSETQFGLWCALAIHDTSSVVGATLQYGPIAVQVGTTVKLARALWIVPLAFGIGNYFQKKNRAEPGMTRATKPWFILGFVFTAAIFTFIPALHGLGSFIEFAAKRLLVLTLFLIGLGLDRATLKSVGLRPFAQGITLWVVMAFLSLAAILHGLIA